MRAAVDVMGGDRAPAGNPQGMLAKPRRCLDGDDLILPRGRRSDHRARLGRFRPALRKAKTRYQAVATTQVIEMDDSPVEAVRNKPDSSHLRHVQAGRQGGEADVGDLRRQHRRVRRGGTVAHADAARRQPAGHLRSSCRRFTARSSSAMSARISPPSPSTFSNTPSWPAAYVARCLRHRKTRASGCSASARKTPRARRTVKEARKLMRDEPQINFIGNVEGRDLFQGRRRCRRLRRVRRQHRFEIHRRHGRRHVSDDHRPSFSEADPELLDQFKPIMKKIYQRARLAGIRRGAAAGRGGLLPDLPRPIRSPGDQKRHPRRQAAGCQRRQPEDRRRQSRKAFSR